MRGKRLLIRLLLALCLPQDAIALDIHIDVTDQHGDVVNGAVVSLVPFGDKDPVEHEMLAVMDQRGLAFVPQVIAVATGSRVEFPNSDALRHQVYSFSNPKRFELKLYSNQSTPSIAFDKPGLVTLGCNIHDWMRGYIYVMDEPYFSVTDDTGDTSLDVPPGTYQLVARHPRQKSEATDVITVDDAQAGKFAITIHIFTKGDLPRQAEPAGGLVY